MSGAQTARKPIDDPQDKTPAWLKAQGVKANDWRLWLNVDDEALKEFGGDMMRLLAVITAAAMRQGKRNSEYRDAEKIEGPPDSLLAMVEQYECVKCKRKTADANHCGKPGRWTGYAACTSKNAADLAGLLPANASRAMTALEEAGFIRRTGKPVKGERQFWLCTKRTPLKDRGVINVDNEPAELPVEISQRIKELHLAPRKRILAAVGHQRFAVDPELVADDDYYAAVAAELARYAAEAKAALAQLKDESDARLADLVVNWNKGSETTETGIINSDSSAAGERVIRAEGQNAAGVINPARPLYKERARGISSVSSNKRARPETAAAIQQLGEMLRARVHANFNAAAAKTLFRKCQASCTDFEPAVTVEEIAACAESKARQNLQPGHTIRNPIGLLLHAVPLAIPDWLTESRKALEKWRATRADQEQLHLYEAYCTAAIERFITEQVDPREVADLIAAKSIAYRKQYPLVPTAEIARMATRDARRLLAVRANLLSVEEFTREDGKT